MTFTLGTWPAPQPRPWGPMGTGHQETWVSCPQYLLAAPSPTMGRPSHRSRPWSMGRQGRMGGEGRMGGTRHSPGRQGWSGAHRRPRIG